MEDGLKSLKIEIQSDGGAIDQSAWETEIGTDFPVRIVQAEVALRLKDQSLVKVSLNRSERAEIYGPLECTLKGSPSGLSSLVINCSAPGQLVEGTLWLESDDRSLEFGLKEIRGEA